YLTQPNMGFRSGDRFRIRFSPDQDCFVYVLHEGSDGRFSMLFPLSAIEGGMNWVMEGHVVQIPSTGQLVVDDQPGVERMHIIAAVQPVQFLESLRGRENQIPPDEFKAALKNLDIAYKVEGVKWSHLGPEFTHEVIKNSPVLHCNVEVIHN
ncbi:MAG: DUF4384 domain-containing protein, partial [Candidatus Sumerlaeota bacterium]|nr:DUF4384 domain-containing protein [Candidatus Sumerlaeota bacterium]